MEISIQDIQYAAGFFDGEGCIRIERKKRQPNTFVVNVRITNTNREVLDWFKVRFNGMIGIQPPNKNVNTNKKCWYWKCESRIANAFLKTIIPLLVIKREQAQVAIDFQSRVKRGANRLTVEEIEIRQGMSVKVCELKDMQHLVKYEKAPSTEYIIGFIDGEGTILVYDVPGPHYELSVSIANTNTSILGLLKERLCGCVTVKEVREIPCFDWRIQGERAASLLTEFLPRLICKREQAVLGIEFQDKKEALKQCGEVLRDHGHFFQSYKDRISLLNRGFGGAPSGTPPKP